MIEPFHLRQPTADIVPIPKIPTRIPGVDDVLRGGLPANRVTVVSGGPGTGKTALALESVYRAAKLGEPSLFVTFEETAAAVRQNALAMGWDLQSLEDQGTLLVTHPKTPNNLVLNGEFTIDGLLAILDGQIKQVGAQRLVIDAIDVLLRIFHHPTTREQQLTTLHNWLRDRAVTTILTMKGSDRDGGRSLFPLVDYMADCAISLDQRVVGQVATRRLRVTKYRGATYFSNEYPFIITTGGVVLMPVTSVALVQQPMGKRITTGTKALDAHLGGGFRRGAAVLLTGASGTGKTTMAGSFALHAAEQGERVLYVSFEEAGLALVNSLQSAGINLQPQIDAQRLTILTAVPEAFGVEAHLLRIFNAMQEVEPGHVVVDAISACRRMGDPQAAFEFLIRLLNHCKARGITCVCTQQLLQPAGAREVAATSVSSLVDALILLDQVHDPVHQRRLLVLKARGTRHAHNHQPFAITDRGIDFSPPPEAVSSGRARTRGNGDAEGGAA